MDTPEQVAQELCHRIEKEWSRFAKTGKHPKKLAVYIADALTTFAAQQVAQAKRETWEKAIKIGCRRCSEGFPVKFLLRPGPDGRTKQWLHPLGKGRDHAICQSDEFRRRAQATI